MRGALRGLLAASMVGCVLVTGCDDGNRPGEDAGILLPDAARGDAGPGADAGEPGEDAGPGTGCGPVASCDDGDACTEDSCRDGVCWNSHIFGCDSCRSDADCDDRWECSTDSCEGGICAFGWSGACECVEDLDCDDGSPGTVDRCVDYRCEREARTCAADPECDDGDRCTVDTCAGETCTWDRIPGCGTTCPDRDGDGHGSPFGCFGGTDCDDSDPARHPGATEDCDDGIDNDCDGRTDGLDSACSTGGETCASARSITPGTPLTGTVVWDGSAGTMRMPCGASHFFTLAVAETSDVDVTVTLEEPPPPTPVPGCPECTPEHRWDYWFRLFLETTCGDTTTDLNGGGTWCRTWSSGGFFPGSSSETIRLRRVAPGSYTVELQASDWPGWMLIGIRYTISVTLTPSDPPMCGAAGVLADGVTARGRTGSGSDAFGTDCTGRVTDAPESLHAFTLTERRRVRLEAAGVPDPTTGAVPGLRLGLLGACDPAATRIDCLEHSGMDCLPRATLERLLDPGSYTLVVEHYAGGDVAYDLTLRTEADGAACAGAPVIAASGSYSGSTAGLADGFRDHRVCGAGYAPDRVYRVDVTERSRVVLDLIASYSRSMLTLFRACGDDRIAGGRTSTRVDQLLDPGTYYAVVGGQQPMDEGGYVLNATFVPTPAP
jgi:hypothetical protein